MSDINELISELCELFDVENFHVKRLTPKIFICGGEISDQDDVFLSIRDFFYKKIKNENPELFSRFVLAEDINQWFGDNHYENLLDLEKDLAGLVAGLPIFVESAGSLAELGAFSVIPEICKKLLVFISDEHSYTRSFIWLGPLKKIEEEKIRPYEFKKANPESYSVHDFVDIQDLVVEDFQTYCVEKSHKRDFKPDNVAHLILLISDLVFIGVLVKKKEIMAMLTTTLGSEISPSDLSKFLWIAEKMGMLEIVKKYGDIYYYVPLDIGSEHISFSFKEEVDNEKKDRLKWRTDFLELIEKDSRRSNALKEVTHD